MRCPFQVRCYLWTPVPLPSQIVFQAWGLYLSINLVTLNIRTVLVPEYRFWQRLKFNYMSSFSTVNWKKKALFSAQCGWGVDCRSGAWNLLKSDDILARLSSCYHLFKCLGSWTYQYIRRNDENAQKELARTIRFNDVLADEGDRSGGGEQVWFAY